MKCGKTSTLVLPAAANGKLAKTARIYGWLVQIPKSQLSVILHQCTGTISIGRMFSSKIVSAVAGLPNLNRYYRLLLFNLKSSRRYSFDQFPLNIIGLDLPEQNLTR